MPAGATLSAARQDGTTALQPAAAATDVAIAIQQHSAMVQASCRRFLGGHHAELDDACQAVFIAMIDSRHSLHEAAALPAWLHRTAVHACLHVIRDERRRHQREVGYAVLRAQEQSDHQGTDGDDLQAALDAAIAALPRAQREAIIGCYYEGLPQEDLAARAG
jgi:RNA polymerase sigma factor (sigma-70 family)